jgi:hypothetical protein
MSIMSSIISDGKKSNIKKNANNMSNNHNQSYNNQSKRTLATKCVS